MDHALESSDGICDGQSTTFGALVPFLVCGCVEGGRSSSLSLETILGSLGQEMGCASEDGQRREGEADLRNSSGIYLIYASTSLLFLQPLN